ncbi:MAG: M28 family peptidase, partial [Deltaproteobacteria bacterium]|nr:M28 family peptidase [Deltaproteobacteria bacterium]
MLALPATGTIAAVTDKDAAQYRAVIERLSALGDRSTGTPGNQEAADYIKDRLSQFGFEVVESHKFAVPVMRYGESTLSIPERGTTVPIHPIDSNAITPQTIASPGISGPLIYAGSGELDELGGKTVEDAIILMELESGKNWLYAANLGARALIYVDRGNTPKIFFEEKFELSPLQFPRFWMPISQVKALFPDFEKKPDGLVAEQINLLSEVSWERVVSENVYAVIPGADPKLEEQAVMVEAFYDSTAWVAGLSPGADEACGIASLLYLAKYLKENPPQRTVILVAT